MRRSFEPRCLFGWRCYALGRVCRLCRCRRRFPLFRRARRRFKRPGGSILVRLHQDLISPHDGDNCVFDPTCSAYAQLALERWGALGWAAASERLLRCHAGNAQPPASILLRTPDPLPEETRWNFWGGAMSAAVPGLGQAAGGKTRDGVSAFMRVAVFGLGAVYYARRGQRMPAAACGGAAFFFYIGNLYGGAKALAQ